MAKKAKKETNNLVHTFGKINKYIIFFGMLSTVLNLGYLMNSAWYANALKMVEGAPVAQEPVYFFIKFVTVNVLIIFGVAAVLLQFNHFFARRENKAIYGVTLVSAGLLIWSIISNILMFVEI